MSSTNHVSPSDVGKRVSFQYELPNGYITEVVGTFEYYDDGAQTYLVRTKAGELARVPLRGVRHGKVVPASP
ncbi:MAG: hypothetical protein WD556_08835 [Actinomycetota bacterium]